MFLLASYVVEGFRRSRARNERVSEGQLNAFACDAFFLARVIRHYYSMAYSIEDEHIASFLRTGN